MVCSPQGQATYIVLGQFNNYENIVKFYFVDTRLGHLNTALGTLNMIIDLSQFYEHLF